MFGNRQISDFVNDKKLVVRIPFQNPFECSFFISCLEFLNQLMTVDEDGFDALAKVSDYHPDLIFCDILMPRLDGYQTCAIIKRNARFANVPVVMLSSKDGVFDKARGRMVGAQDYLTKPFTKDQLLKAVEQFGVAAQGVV